MIILQEKDNHFYADLNGRMVQLDNTSPHEWSHIRDKFRDHNDIEGGSMNFVSPIYKYFGWYAPNYPQAQTKSDDAAKDKKWYSPTVIRLGGETDYKIESITMDHISLTHTDTKRKQAYMTTTMLVESAEAMKAGKKWHHTSSGQEIHSVDYAMFYNMPVICNGFHNGDIIDKYPTEIILVQIDWNQVPKDGYVVIGSIGSETYKTQYRFARIDTNKTETAIFSGATVQDLSLGSLGDVLEFQKITKGSTRYTWLALEGRELNSLPGNNVQGLWVNMYVPEELFYECRRDEKDMLYIKDVKDVGKLYNAYTSMSDYRHLPYSPKQGDILKVLDNINLDENGKQVYKEYICMHGWNGSHKPDIRNPLTSHHVTFNQMRFPVAPIIDETALDIYLGHTLKNRRNVFKRIEPAVEIPESPAPVIQTGSSSGFIPSGDNVMNAPDGKENYVNVFRKFAGWYKTEDETYGNYESDRNTSIGIQSINGYELRRWYSMDILSINKSIMNAPSVPGFSYRNVTTSTIGTTGGSNVRSGQSRSAYGSRHRIELDNGFVNMTRTFYHNSHIIQDIDGNKRGFFIAIDWSEVPVGGFFQLGFVGTSGAGVKHRYAIVHTSTYGFTGAPDGTRFKDFTSTEQVEVSDYPMIGGLSSTQGFAQINITQPEGMQGTYIYVEVDGYDENQWQCNSFTFDLFVDPTIYWNCVRLDNTHNVISARQLQSYLSEYGINSRGSNVKYNTLSSFNLPLIAPMEGDILRMLDSLHEEEEIGSTSVGPDGVRKTVNSPFIEYQEFLCVPGAIGNSNMSTPAFYPMYNRLIVNAYHIAGTFAEDAYSFIEEFKRLSGSWDVWVPLKEYIYPPIQEAPTSIFVEVTKAEYDRMQAAGELKEGTYYTIKNE